MLEKPDIADELIIDCLHRAYGLQVTQLTFLPLGADLHSAVYRVNTTDRTALFLKLRSGNFNETSVWLPHFLQENGLAEVIPIYPTSTGQLWRSLAEYQMMLYPFIEGHNAHEVPLSEAQWRQFGRALREVHTVVLPAALAAKISPETYSGKWRQVVKEFMQRIEHVRFAEPVASRMAAFLNLKRQDIVQLLQRTEALAQILQQQPQALVLCHADIHAWNLLLAEDGALYMVDWDDPVMAPRERDLMFVGAGLGNIWHSARESALFYEGYGQAGIDQNALAYYRCERIIQDIAAYCDQIFLTEQGGPDREEALKQLTSNFSPHGTLDIAMKTGHSWPDAGV